MRSRRASRDVLGCRRRIPGKKQGNIAMRVLVADDNVDAAQVLQVLLGILGHQVAVAYDGRAAVEKFLVERPQLCILDIGMPKMTGLEVAEAIRAVDPSTYLVALSGWCQEADRAASS